MLVLAAIHTCNSAQHIVFIEHRRAGSIMLPVGVVDPTAQQHALQSAVNKWFNNTLKKPNAPSSMPFG